jgi:deoxyribodipyrimidine photo-lyase
VPATWNAARLRRLNEAAIRRGGDYVLYWMQASRRLHYSHALDYALLCCEELGRPLVVYEGLRHDYPWASRRLHRFVLEGMRENAAAAERLGIAYWPFVGSPDEPGRGLLARLAQRAALVVTDDFPCFIVPEQSQALARRVEVPVFALDGNGLFPLASLGEAAGAAAHLRPRLHRAFQDAWEHRARARPRVAAAARGGPEPPFEAWAPESLDATLEGLPFEDDVAPVPGVAGGSRAARRRLKAFLAQGLEGYAEQRSPPVPPDEARQSRLSAWLHFGHISAQEIAERALERHGSWSVDELRYENRGRRAGFFGEDADLNAFLDELLTWRDLGHLWQRHRRQDARDLESALPGWAWETLQTHAGDERPWCYEPDQLEAADTHDPLWNAAQRELKATGAIHNYLRMLWGKKVLEWSRHPEVAYRTLVHLNNKYALDGRDPNSWSGILWCFGLFDRPWAPERAIFGRVRYMSSDNTARKFKLDRYLRWVEGLPGERGRSLP